MLCGFYYERGELSRRTYVGDLLYGRDVLSCTTLRGYHAWAIPLVRYMEETPESLLIPLLRPIVKGWAQEMAFRTGYAKQGSQLGKVLLHTAAPLCTLIGSLIEQAPALTPRMRATMASVGM